VQRNTVQHRLPVEGADYQILAGINDANLQELARLTSCRVILRGDYLVLSGELADVERAVPAAQQLVDMARLGTVFGVEDVRRAVADAGLNGKFEVWSPAVRRRTGASSSAARRR